MLNLYRKGWVIHMGIVTVKFLGEEYQISEAIRQFLEYDQLLAPIYGRIIQSINSDIQTFSRTVTFDSFGVDTVDTLRKNIRT